MTSKIVRVVSRAIFPLVLVYGLYIIIHGHLTPGGGFQGGAIIASGIALLLISGKKFKKDKFAILEALGLLAFILLAFIGLKVSFFRNFIANTDLPFGMKVKYGPNPGNLNTGGVLPLMNLVVGLEVIGAISTIIIMML